MLHTRCKNLLLQNLHTGMASLVSLRAPSCCFQAEHTLVWMSNIDIDVCMARAVRMLKDYFLPDSDGNVREGFIYFLLLLEIPIGRG